MLANVVILGPEVGEHDIAAMPGKLWHFSNDYGRFLAFAKAMPIREVAPVGEAINLVATRIRHDIINIDSHLYTGWSLLSWAASDIGEPNPTMSDFFLNICRTLALIEAAGDGGRHIVVVDDHSYGYALAKIVRRAGLLVETKGLRRDFLRRAVSGLFAHIHFLRDWAVERKAAARQRIPTSDLSATASWLVTWADGMRASIEHTDTDPFFGALPVWLRDAGIRFGWILNPVRWMNPLPIIEALAAALPELSIFSAKFMGPRAVARAYLALFLLPFAVRRRWTFNGFDMSPLVRRALWREYTTSRLVRAAMYTEIALGFKKSGFQPRVLLYTFENQPWEKAMLAGFRRVLPVTTLVGVQHAPLAENYLSGHPGASQWLNGTAPDFLFTIGEEFRSRLLALGAPAERVQVGGALRYAGQKSKSDVEQRGPNNGEPWLVLATCPMDENDCFDLVHKAVAATAGLSGVRLMINYHPMVNAALRKNIEQWIQTETDCAHVEFVDGNAASLLSRSHILLYNSSSTAFEAAAQGVPIVSVGSSLGIDVDSCAGPGVIRCRNVIELRGKIMGLIDSSATRRASVEAGQRFLAACFSESRPNFWVDMTADTHSVAASQTIRTKDEVQMSNSETKR